MAILSAPLATTHPWLHSLPPPTPGRVPERHVGGCAGARAQSGGLPLLSSCRVRELVAHRALPRRVARRGKLYLRCLGRPSRQAPLAGVLSPWLGYFVLECLQRNHGGPWRSPGKPCRGSLRLPVHKFRILRYPYFSTPTKSISNISSVLLQNFQ